MRAAAREASWGLDVPLETKLHAPVLRKEWLERPELVHYLSGTAAKLVLVDAPAGFGKTILVAQWRVAEGQARRFAWVSLDTGDNDPARLWWHVISSLRRACPEIGPDSGLWLRRASAQGLTEALLSGLVNELAALRCRVVLVLDDYHVIKNHGCHEQIRFVQRHLPAAVQIVLITRADPPLPLARLRAVGDMAEIRTRDLRFTPAETAALVYATAGIQLCDSDVADLVERTEGWPAGIYLAALSLRGNPCPSAFIQQFTGSNRFIVDFLAEEVLNQQPPEIRQFLMRTSILERFTAPLCDAVAETSNSAEVIEKVGQNNLFLRPLDDNRMWYRYHHLFAQMLRIQLARTEPEILPALHRRASVWHRRAGSAEEAVAHALSAGDSSGAADLIARHWYGFVNAGRAETVRGWIHSLGHDRIGDEPVAAHCAAWVAALCGDRDSVHRWLAVVEAGQYDGPLPDGMKSLTSSAALLRGTFGFDGIRAMRESAAAAVELERDPTSPWYVLARAAFGFSLCLSGDIAAAAVVAEQAVLGVASIPVVRMLALAIASLVATEDGRVAQARELAWAARQIGDGAGLSGSPHSSLAHTAAGAVHSSEGRLEEARSEFEQALRARRQWFGISPWPTADTLLRLASVQLDMGDRPGAAARLAEARDVLSSMPERAEALQARVTRLELRLAGASWGTPLAEPLTEREETVLRLLRGTVSLREIGQELYLSANTIKTHTRAIYRKLGVSTRRDAVERARDAGLLP
ncbi:MAG: LuxR C-terminal-related transcriptional regulator [Micromonosporaceae bacterium]